MEFFLRHNHLGGILLCASSVGSFILGEDSLMHEAVFIVVVKRVDILIAINIYLHSNLTVQMVRPLNLLTHNSHSFNSPPN